MKNGKVKGIVLTLVGGIFWGVGGSCGQYLFENKEVNSGLLVPIRLFAAGLLILVLQLIRKEKIFDIWKEKRDAAETLLFALFGMMLCQYSYFTTIQYSNAGTATVLQYTGPAMILVYLCVKAKRWPKAYEIAALIFSCGGVFVLATHGDLSSLALPPEALFLGDCCGSHLGSLQPSTDKNYRQVFNPYGNGLGHDNWRNCPYRNYAAVEGKRRLGR